MVESCGEEPCPSWGSWGEWSACSRSCGEDGRRRRARQCTDPVTGQDAGYSCPGVGQRKYQVNGLELENLTGIFNKNVWESLFEYFSSKYIEKLSLARRRRRDGRVQRLGLSRLDGVDGVERLLDHLRRRKQEQDQGVQVGVREREEHLIGAGKHPDRLSEHNFFSSFFFSDLMVSLALAARAATWRRPSPATTTSPARTGGRGPTGDPAQPPAAEGLSAGSGTACCRGQGTATGATGQTSTDASGSRWKQGGGKEGGWGLGQQNGWGGLGWPPN